MGVEIQGVRIDNKTSVTRIPNLTYDLRRRLLDEQLLTFGALKKCGRANEPEFIRMLQRLKASPTEIGYLILVIRKGQNSPPHHPNQSRRSQRMSQRPRQPNASPR